MRLTQNYITEENFKSIPDLKVEEVGRLQFTGRFKAGTDHDHERFVTDNDSRETQETWEACHSEGVRADIVTKELPPAVQELHDQSLTQGRDVLSQADEKEKTKWLSKDGTDWSGAFGQDPAQYADRKGSKKDARNIANSNSTNMANGSTINVNENRSDDEYDEDDYDSLSSDSDLGIHDGENHEQYEANNLEKGNSNASGQTQPTEGAEGENGSSHAKNPVKQLHNYNESKKGLHRKQRGLMQWKPMRNLQFAKNETKFAVRRTINKGSLQGRKPDVETET